MVIEAETNRVQTACIYDLSGDNSWMLEVIPCCG